MKRNKYNHPEEEVSRNEELQLKKVKHKNIIKFHAFVEDDLCWMFVFEYCQHGSLFDMIKKRKTLSEPEIRYIAYQLITTLMFLLEKYIIH
jgi:serine/threonine protein kinase